VNENDDPRPRHREAASLQVSQRRFDQARLPDPGLSSDRIGHLPDVSSRPPGHHRSMRIEIDLEATEPPSGLVIGPGEERVRFAGWLELLRGLSDLFQQTTQTDGPSGGMAPSGEA
jgi:hypothetical protein